MWFWEKGKEVEAFGKGLVDVLSSIYPPASQASGAEPTARQVHALTELYQKAERFHQQHKLGVYTKAKLANAVQWQMREAGFSDKFVKDVASTLAMRLATRRRE